MVLEDSEPGCRWAFEAGAMVIRVAREGVAGGRDTVPNFTSAARCLVETYC